MGQKVNNKEKVYQGQFEYFYGSNSGYGSVRTHYTNIFSTCELCKINLDKVKVNFKVKSWCIKEYTLDSENKPTIVNPV